MTTPPPPPSSDKVSLTAGKAKQRITKALTELSLSLSGGHRATLDRYLTIFSKTGQEDVLPVTRRPYSDDKPWHIATKSKTECLFLWASETMVRYWAYSTDRTEGRQNRLDSAIRKLEHLASKGWDEYVCAGADAHGYTLMTTDQEERLREVRDAAVREKRGG